MITLSCFQCPNFCVWWLFKQKNGFWVQTINIIWLSITAKFLLRKKMILPKKKKKKNWTKHSNSFWAQTLAWRFFDTLTQNAFDLTQQNAYGSTQQNAYGLTQQQNVDGSTQQNAYGVCFVCVKTRTKLA